MRGNTRRRAPQLPSNYTQRRFNAKLQVKPAQRDYGGNIKMEGQFWEGKREQNLDQAQIWEEQEQQRSQKEREAEIRSEKVLEREKDVWDASTQNYLWDGGKTAGKRPSRQTAKYPNLTQLHQASQKSTPRAGRRRQPSQQSTKTQSRRSRWSAGQKTCTNCQSQTQSQRTSHKKRRVNIDTRILHTIAELFQTRSVNNLITLQNIASRLDLSYSTVCKLYREWSQDSNMFARKMQLRRPKDKKQESTQLRMKALERLLYINPYLTQCEMVDELNKLPEIRASKGLITRFIIYDLLKFAGFVKKKTRRVWEKRNEAESKLMRETFCRRYKQLLISPSTSLFFLGELEMNIFGMRSEGWCKKDQELTLRCPNASAKTVSAPFIVFRNGCFMAQAKLGPLEKSDLYAIVQRFMDEIDQKYPNCKNYVVIDPVNLQSRFKIEQFKKQFKVQQVLFLPPFSPQLSIIEHFFHHLKEKLRVRKIDSEVRLREEFEKIIKEDQSRVFSNLFQRTRHYVEMGIQRRDF